MSILNFLFINRLWNNTKLKRHKQQPTLCCESRNSKLHIINSFNVRTRCATRERVSLIDDKWLLTIKIVLKCHWLEIIVSCCFSIFFFCLFTFLFFLHNALCSHTSSMSVIFFYLFILLLSFINRQGTHKMC